MAVSKALCKSTALRSATPAMGALLAVANTEVSRDNPEMLFVTAFAAILDLGSGELAYCNAGHEDPYLVSGRFARPAHHRRRRSAAARWTAFRTGVRASGCVPTRWSASCPTA